MNFYETETGCDFFKHQLPELVRALQGIAAALSRPTPEIYPPGAGGGDILRDLYYGTYEPDTFRQDGHSPLDRNVRRAEKELLEGLSPHARKLFTQYQDAVSERGSAETELAYRSGFRTAVRILLAGGGYNCLPPIHATGMPSPDTKTAHMRQSGEGRHGN